MMEETEKLTIEELNIIKESLGYSTYNVENSQSQSSYEVKRDKLNAISVVRAKISELIKNRKD
jgi:hypothetical protein